MSNGNSDKKMSEHNEMIRGETPASASNQGQVSIADLFSSRGRVKIIQVLAKKNELNISEIARQANLNHSTACQHLELLEEAGIIQKKVFGRIKIYRFRLENVRAKAIKHLFELWDETTS